MKRLDEILAQKISKFTELRGNCQLRCNNDVDDDSIDDVTMILMMNTNDVMMMLIVNTNEVMLKIANDVKDDAYD